MSAEIKSNIAKLDAAIKSPATPANMLDKLKAKKSELESELKKLESATKEVKKVEPKTPKKSGYKLGDMYSSDFDYDGMLEMGKKVNSSWSKKDLQKLFDSFEDVNYHTVAAPLHAAIHKSKDKKEEAENIAKFNKLVREELGEKIVEKKEVAKEKIAKEKVVSKAKAKTSKVVSEAKALLEKLRATKAQKSFNAGKTKEELERDLKREALPIGKRISAEGNTYYEYRSNRADVSTKRKPYLEDGGEIENDFPPVIFNIESKEQGKEIHKKVLDLVGGKNFSIQQKGDRDYYFANDEESFFKLTELYDKTYNQDNYPIKVGEMVKVKKYGWVMRVDKIEDDLFFLENDKRGTGNGNAGSYFKYELEKVYAEGGEISEDKLWEWVKNIDDENLLSWCGYSSKKEFENSADTNYSKRNLFESNYDDLLYAYENKSEYGFAKGGEIEDEQSFHKGDKVKKKTTGEKAEVLNLNKGGNSLMESYSVITEDGKHCYWWATDMEVCYECGGRMMERGGYIKNQYQGKTAEQVWDEWTIAQRSHFLLDHIGRAKVEEYRDKDFDKLSDTIHVELEFHVTAGQYEKGGVAYNTGRSWHQDRAMHNKAEDWEKPLSQRKMKMGGEITSDVVDAIFYSNQKNIKGGKSIINTDFGAKPYIGLEAMILDESDSPKKIAEAIFYSNEKRGVIETGYGRKDIEGLTQMIEDARKNKLETGGEVYAKGGGMTFGDNKYSVPINTIEPTKSYRFEIYTKDPITGHGGWEIKFIHVFAKTKEQAKEKLKEYPLFDTIILYDGEQEMTDAEIKKYANGYDFLNATDEDFEKGGKVTFKDKVKAIEERLKNKKVPTKYKKEYGNTYDKTEAHEAATKIAGAMVQKGKMEKGGKVDYESRCKNDSLKISNTYKKVIESDFDEKQYDDYKKLLQKKGIPKKQSDKIEQIVSTNKNYRPIDVYQFWDK
jgi:hypothetical protein